MLTISDNFIIGFEKSSDYKRCVVTHVMPHINRNLIALNILEETTPLPEKYIIDGSLNMTTVSGDLNLINVLHATLMINPSSLPGIIEVLQNLNQSLNHVQPSDDGGVEEDGTE